MKKTTRSIDVEQVAALIDGHLNGVDATAVRHELSVLDDDMLTAFVDAATTAAETGTPPTLLVLGTGSQSIRGHRQNGLDSEIANLLALIALEEPRGRPLR